jgi:YVTN family beta-propeller protein
MRNVSSLLAACALVIGTACVAPACTKGKDAAPPTDDTGTKASPSAVASAALKASADAPTAPSGPLVYVSDEIAGNVVAVDPAQGKVVATIPVGKRPRGIKLSRDGKLLLVAVTGSPMGGPNVDESKLPPGDRDADGIGVVDIAARKLTRVLKSGQDPEAFDLSLDGKTVFVSNEETAEMSVVDLASGEIKRKVPVGKEPEGVTVRPDGKVVYVTSEEDSEVTAVDAETFAVVGHMKTAKRPRALVFAKDGTTAFVTDEVGHAVTVLDTAALKVLETIKITQDSPTPTGPRPMGIVLSNDGKTVYAACGRGGNIAVIDVATRKQVRSIDGVGDRPWGIAQSLDGTKLYTANGSSKDMSIVDLATGKVDKRVHIGISPWGLVLAPR